MVGMISYLISFLGILFWGFRVVVVFCATMQIDFMVTPINLNLEIALLFVLLILYNIEKVNTSKSILLML